ncbi:tRNA epoxyqueuosine(34) reductase QueG [Parvibaculum sp.]|uniref:tRNA epoxyqueuosine(34) reductase QueG n=1 Tax=Parvibaculum sp. TaxID=2024848 RepID=UPI0027317B30|nr:tRNA epoxyqueuosine(34) reductase QueG [Parvibaculum sp.]MDP1626286.1 tRNA epoxyqueuosine(34) reductase QueG [Parvibaculum sp.]MDP2150617.1 tRNA epoxyqueuosine(34) reductase QueG [Parvibaculum sp.]MDP3328985.1 tRNA epoxyqueuosine(34) reductase QueG [Parvibaculum sp.]
MPISISDRPKELNALRGELLARAKEAGFDDAGIARADARDDLPARLDKWLKQGRHGGMDWMAETAARRAAPATLWPEAKSVIMLAMNYGPDTDPLKILEQRDRAAISAYAQNRDYHDLVKKRLKQVARWLAETSGAEVKVFVDTAPVMEKPLAEAAGLGWQGKHTNLVSRNLGSWFFLGSIFTTLEFEADERHDDRCGECRRCLDVCPTKAFPAPYELDARRCISYLTIEHKGHIAREFRAPMGNRIYGCDDCLAVCPWNKFASLAREDAFHPRDELRAPLLADLARLDDPSFRAFFSGSPIKRIGRDRFVRNVLIAIGNSGEKSLVPVALPLLDDASPLVRAMAIWALSRLGEGDALRAQAQAALRTETDEGVREEWDYCLR